MTLFSSGLNAERKERSNDALLHAHGQENSEDGNLYGKRTRFETRMKAAEILAGPPSPAPPTEPSRDEKSRRVKIWCAACEMFHRLPRTAALDEHQITQREYEQLNSL